VAMREVLTLSTGQLKPTAIGFTQRRRRRWHLLGLDNPR
jgi:hypothetical protein